MSDNNQPIVFRSYGTIRDAVRIKVVTSGARRPLKEIFLGADRHRAADRWVERQRVIDRENDSYVEIVTEEGTGIVIHECREPLSQHRGHGSDKKKSGAP